MIITTGSAIESQLTQEMGRMKTLAESPVSPASPLDTPLASKASDDVSFSKVMNSALERVDDSQRAALESQTAVEMGQSDDLAGAMIASQQASLTFSALVQVRNKVASGFNDLMSMSV